MRIVPTIILLSVLASGQANSAQPQNAMAAAVKSSDQLTIPAGTKVPLSLKHAISTRQSREDDAVYAETTFPVVANDRVLIPAGTFVQGRITHIQRAGRIKGRAEVLIHFTSMIYPSGYTVMLPGAVQNAPGVDKPESKTAKERFAPTAIKRRRSVRLGAWARQEPLLERRRTAAKARYRRRNRWRGRDGDRSAHWRQRSENGRRHDARNGDPARSLRRCQPRSLSDQDRGGYAVDYFRLNVALTCAVTETVWGENSCVGAGAAIIGLILDSCRAIGMIRMFS